MSANQFSSFFPSNTPDASSTDEINRKSARRSAYGIASVFSLMLILLAVLGAMLWHQ